MNEKKPEIKFRDLGDAAIEYLDYGGNGPAVVLLHATGFLPWTWHPIARELSVDHRVIVPYFCDHREAEPDEGLSWVVLADDLARFSEGLGLRKPYLVGHSMGATVATICAARSGLSVSGMVLIEPIYLPSPVYRMDMKVDDHPLARLAIRRRNGWSGPGEAMDYLRSKKLFAGWDEEALELYLRHGMVEEESGGLTLACHPRREASLFMGSRAMDPWPLLADVSCPVLVVEGEESENRPFIDLKKAATDFPLGEHRLVEAAGHLVPMERPKEVLALIRRFIRDNPSKD